MQGKNLHYITFKTPAKFEFNQIGKGSKKSYGGYKKRGRGYSKYDLDDDYRLTVGGNVDSSRFDTASDHDVRVKGNIQRSNVHNYGGK